MRAAGKADEEHEKKCLSCMRGKGASGRRNGNVGLIL